MNIDDLKTAGFNEQEIQQYQGLVSAGFSDKEITDHYANQSTPGGGKKPSGAGADIPQMDRMDAVNVGLDKGFMELYRGVSERALEVGNMLGITDPERLDNLRKVIADEAHLYDAKKTTSGREGYMEGGRFVAKTLPALAIPGGVGGKALTRALTGAGAGAATGALDPTQSGGETAGNIAAGAGLGAGGSITLSFLGKLYNSVRGNLIPKYNELIDLAKKHGVRISVGDITANPNVQRGEVLLEHVPIIGMKDFRAGQNTEADEAVKRFMGQFGSGTLNENEKKLRDSLLVQLGKNKKEVDQLYDAFYQAADKVGKKVEVTNLKATVNGLLKEYPDVFSRLPDTSLENKLRTIAKGTGGELATMSPSEMAFLRKKLNNYLSRAEKSVGAVGDEEIHALSQIKTSLQTDMDHFAATHPDGGVVSLYKKANQAYIDKVVPYKDTVINKVTRQNYDADLLFQQFIKPDRVNLAGKLTKTVEPSEKDTMKYTILRHAYDLASPEKTGKPVFSPQTFATTIKKLNEVNKNIFSPGELQQLQGMTNLSEHVARAGQYTEKPPTGYRLVPLSLVGLGAAGTYGKDTTGKVKTVAEEAAFVGALTLALTTPAGRNLLLSASRVKPGTPAMNTLVNQIYNQASKVPVTAFETLGGVHDTKQDTKWKSIGGTE